MKLTDYIRDLGRAVAYYPKLKKVTGSTTSSILLCQLLYWSDKTDNGWIRKSSDDLEEETGLTYWEQQSARKNLVSLGLIEEIYRRLDHCIDFKVNQECLNTLWEEVGGEKIKKMTAPQKEDSSEIKKRAGVKKGDALDGLLASQFYEGNMKTQELRDIKSKVESRLGILANNRDWENFINFCYVRQHKHNQDVDTFLSWALREGFDVKYWTPVKMQTMYPQAFATKEDSLREDFVKPLPEKIEKEIAPMPESLKVRNRNSV